MATTKKTTTRKAKSYKKTPKKDVHQIITDQIIASLESGTGAWQKGWTCGDENGINSLQPVNASTGKAYTGINRLILALMMMNSDYEENKWVTYKQAQAEGWQVIRKQTGIMLAYYGTAEKKQDAEAQANNEDKEYYKFANPFTVFNVAQLEGYEAKETITPPAAITENHPLLQRILENTEVRFLPEAGNEAFYVPSQDVIQMPPRKAFKSDSAYASVICHELVHSVKLPHRCDRDYKSKYDTKEAYAREELVAELGAAFLCSEMDCVGETIENHASYINSWIQLLKHDKKAIFKAAADAQKSTDFIMREWAEKAQDDTEQAA